MSVLLNKYYRMRSSIAIVYVDGVLELFKTNIRESIRVKINYSNVESFLCCFDGTKSLADVLKEYPEIDADDAVVFVAFLNENSVLIEVDASYREIDILEKPRHTFQLEEYACKTSEALEAISKVEEKTVLILGLGAVGTWVCSSLAMSGVKNFILVDPDCVDITNLHRQDCFLESDVGSLKVDCVERRLSEISDVSIKKIVETLDYDFFKRNFISFDLAINCADYPSVDVTTEIVGKECMVRKLPHIVGGGYNLHLTLIGQSIIPGLTACVQCFKKQLEEINSKDIEGVEKLYRPSRKIGSFGPLCSLSASIASNEAIKILSENYSDLVTANKRVEFRLDEMDFYVKEMEKKEDCSWCGSNGIYSQGSQWR